jgi:cell division septation protein DedD
MVYPSRTPRLRNLMENLVVQGVAAIVALAVYFLPSIIADRRKRYDLLTIALFNAVVGWTVFGWLLALYWALQTNPPKNVAGEIVKSRKLVSMRTFSTMLAERVRLRSSRNNARERSSK